MKNILLHTLPMHQRARIVQVYGKGAFRKRMLEMGFVPGRVLTPIRRAPLGDPVCYQLMGSMITLRDAEAQLVEVEMVETLAEPKDTPPPSGEWQEKEKAVPTVVEEEKVPSTVSKRSRRTKKSETTTTLRVALLGNPNAGKTTLFNLASGAHEHTGNYGGVTVQSHTGYFTVGDYHIALTDLPGTYSITPYTPEEKYVEKYLREEKPDVILNVVDANLLERNLYLSLQLLELGIPMVIALNMWDEFKQTGHRLNRPALSHILGASCVPTVGRTGEGLDSLLQAIIRQYHTPRSTPVFLQKAYTPPLERAVHSLQKQAPSDAKPSLYQCLGTLELLSTDDLPSSLAVTTDPIPASAWRTVHQELEKQLQGDVGSYITNMRYATIDRILQQTLVRAPEATKKAQKRNIDKVLTHRIWGLPIFLLSMFVMFWLTFSLGEYPMWGIEVGVAWIAQSLSGALPPGPLHDLLIDGVLGGVGSVIVFLPQILILFFCISIMEDTGYMARAVFLVDRAMRAMGLHGRSFIPLVMGFGCNVPAVMATRTIESKNIRMATILIMPFMSCSGKLPVYILIAPIIFPGYEALTLFCLYLLGIVVAILLSVLFRNSFLKGQESPFIIELPPYRLPTLRAATIHMWEKGKIYLKKMGTIILLASIVIWALAYFPRPTPWEEPSVEVENTLAYTDSIPSTLEHESYLNRLGHKIEPLIEPLGFDWRIGVAFLSGLAAKEVVVSTMALTLHVEEGDDMEGKPLRQALQEATIQSGSRKGEPLFTQASGLSFLAFVVLYIPCIAMLTGIFHETGKWKWSLYAMLYTTGIAYLVSLAIFQVGTYVIS